MGATPFKALDWAPHEPITKDKLDAMQANNQWLLENVPRARYRAPSGVGYDSDVAILSGRVLVPRNKYYYQGAANVYFGNVFAPGTVPNISTAIISDQKKQCFCVMNGLGSVFAPDHRGFSVYVNVTQLSARPAKVRGKTQRDTPDRPIYVSWQASGQRAPV